MHFPHRLPETSTSGAASCPPTAATAPLTASMTAGTTNSALPPFQAAGVTGCHA